MKTGVKKIILTVFCVLFCFITLFTAKNSALAYEKKVKIGGEVIGFTIPYYGVQIVGFKDVLTPNGNKNASEFFEKGDLIVSIDGVKIEKVEDIAIYLDKVESKKSVSITVVRNGKEKTINYIPLVDSTSSVKKLGITAKDSISGLGTVTYVKEDGSFGSLGHAVCDNVTKKEIEHKDGTIYNSIITGITKGEKGKAGAIGGYLSSDVIGKIEDTKVTGLYGKILFEVGNEYEIASKDDVKPGKAQICSCISGKKEFYDIEIIRALYQKSSLDKGLIIKINDKRLISLTGGIVQGMSGSPIIQNGKLVGAVTHVFINDPTRGYGIFIENMMN